MKRFLLFATAATTLLALFGMLSVSIAAEESEQQNDQKDKAPFDQQFWSYLKKVEYEESYSPWPGKKDEFIPGKGPHGEQLKIYVNRYVVKNPDDPPHKSIIVKENYTAEKELAAITVMYRVDNYDSDNKDWYWVKYLPDGEVATMNDAKLSGKVTGCIDCHRSAKGNDYIFTNDD